MLDFVGRLRDVPLHGRDRDFLIIGLLNAVGLVWHLELYLLVFPFFSALRNIFLTN